VAYRLELVPSALHELEKVAPDARRRVVRAIDRLAKEPRPPGARALRGDKSGLRIRVGSYRILYEVDDDLLLVTIGRVAPRGKAYR
jgi:mRNA interferase RelE/StbE